MSVTVRLRSGGGSTQAGAGWIYVWKIEGRNGVVISSPTWQDTGSTVLQSAVASGSDLRVWVRASYPLVTVFDVPGTLTLVADGGSYSGYVDVSLTVSADVVAKVFTPDDHEGPHDTVHVVIQAPPNIVTLSFSGSYPGSQTELKAGDTFQLVGTTDRACVGVEILDFEAFQNSVFTFSSSTSFSVTGIVANRGTTSVLRPARARARDASGAYGNTRDTNTGGGVQERLALIRCSNLYPTLTFGSISYPSGQTALKNSETATVAVTSANLDTVSFTSPNSQLSITAPTSPTSPKTVQRIAGNYNVATANLRGEAIRVANDSHTVSTSVVRVAHVASVVSVSEAYARLRLGNPTADYVCTISCDQEIPSAPSLQSSASAHSGTLQGSGWSGGLTSYTRSIRIADSDVPGTYGWRNLSVINRAGIETASITGDASYVIGGIVQRSVTFAAFQRTALINVPITTYSKLQAGIFTATNQQSIRNAVQGDQSNLVDTFTVLALGVNPTTIFWNDLNAANSNSSGTAQLLNIEEIV